MHHCIQRHVLSVGMSWAVQPCSSVAGHSYHVQLLPPHAPNVQLDHVCLNYLDRGRGKRRPLRLRMKKTPHCAAYVLLPCSCSCHDILHSPRYKSCPVSCPTFGCILYSMRQRVGEEPGNSM